MKPFTHPKPNQTLIQRKDGRTYTKSWVFFRNILRNDNDEKVWSQFPSQQTFSDGIKVSDVSKKEKDTYQISNKKSTKAN